MTELGLSPLGAGDPKLSVAEARAAIAAVLRPITETEWVPLAQALGRVLAADVISPIDVPGHDNSAMDGFAFRGADIAPDAATTPAHRRRRLRGRAVRAALSMPAKRCGSPPARSCRAGSTPWCRRSSAVSTASTSASSLA